MSLTGCIEIRSTCSACGIELDEWANAIQPEQTSVGCGVRPRYCRACKGEIDMMTKKIIRNRARCRKCHDIVESTHRYDFKQCRCGAIAVDGGRDYIRRVGNLGMVEEMTEYEEVKDGKA